nr:UdgX family uracil-DNA binding protein [Siccirubricoccus soli]
MLQAGIPPEQVEWCVAGEAPGLFGGTPPPRAEGPPVVVPRAFLPRAEIAIRHRDPARFALLYRLLWRLTHGERHLLEAATDPDILRLEAMEKAVQREAHKLHAFIRFRAVNLPTRSPAGEAGRHGPAMPDPSARSAEGNAWTAQSAGPGTSARSQEDEAWRLESARAAAAGRPPEDGAWRREFAGADATTPSPEDDTWRHGSARADTATLSPEDSAPGHEPAKPDPDSPCYIAWFEPEHHILEAEAGFFIRRFAALRWSILTPTASAHWDGETLTMGPGSTRAEAPPEDAHEELWRAYYASIFNPARLKPAAMRAQMPVRYWKNLPEAREIPRLMAEARSREAAMVARGASPPAPRRQRPLHLRPAPDVATDMPADLFAATEDPATALRALREELERRNDLPPWAAQATQLVFGEGPPGAPLLFVGEQPGDEEDLAGKPFVGPAGRLFDKALLEAGVERPQTYVTNAVKHFKFKPTGRRRLHQSPDAGDIAYYRPFLKREVELVGPQLVVTLGATALRAMTGKPLPIGKNRGAVMTSPDGIRLFPTVHPSYLLRLPDAESKTREYARFVGELKAARREVA